MSSLRVVPVSCIVALALKSAILLSRNAAMGRYDFRPHRVHETATRLLQAERITQAPPWLQTVENIPPAQILIRTQPTQHYEHRQASKARKPSKMFQPQRITYEEDALRRQFFSDHPWELARPRLVLENDGRDAERQDWSERKREEDWSQMGQSARSLDGERCLPSHSLWKQGRLTPIASYNDKCGSCITSRA